MNVAKMHLKRHTATQSEHPNFFVLDDLLEFIKKAHCSSYSEMDYEELNKYNVIQVQLKMASTMHFKN